ncbi:2-amino-4-hydroxy-6-hydroxymethyldihydropteridine diphosphokinase [Membranihabitans maritimus]|uniref:2-amino-4-hydroxy-6- hydroxymethyldihydropteridine diphosphokinase n=1 Tax=Membranihabitans maritimus TaxID=2904244 RepID=UPI001F018259|nr:2-amino-4-hydroxy-6-hydroxymethyldihydropteridine diphosphokinase [Membranihabitans maritimus]
MIYLGLGSNEGDRLKFLNKALEAIEVDIGPIIIRSKFYKTKPWGYDKQNEFINMAIGVETKVPPQELLTKLKDIESKIGRIARSKWHEREIDIDILFYNDIILSMNNLKIPHPYFARRNFVLKPLAEIAPDLKDPITKKDIKTLLRECKDGSYVTPLQV